MHTGSVQVWFIILWFGLETNNLFFLEVMTWCLKTLFGIDNLEGSSDVVSVTSGSQTSPFHEETRQAQHIMSIAQNTIIGDQYFNDKF